MAGEPKMEDEKMTPTSDPTREPMMEGETPEEEPAGGEPAEEPTETAINSSTRVTTTFLLGCIAIIISISPLF